MRKNACIAAATLTITSLSLFAAFVAGRAMPAAPTVTAQLINPFELMARVGNLPTQETEDFSTVY